MGSLWRRAMKMCVAGKGRVMSAMSPPGDNKNPLVASLSAPGDAQDPQKGAHGPLGGCHPPHCAQGYIKAAKNWLLGWMARNFGDGGGEEG